MLFLKYFYNFVSFWKLFFVKSCKKNQFGLQTRKVFIYNEQLLKVWWAMLYNILEKKLGKTEGKCGSL